MDGRMDGWTDGRMDGWTDGRMDGWTDGRMDGWTDGRFNLGWDGYPSVPPGLCNHKAQASSHHACAEDGNLKRPHPPILLTEIIGWIGGWLLVRYGVGGHLTRDLPR